MKYKIRFADKEDYKVINEIIREVHDLHVKNRPDVYNETDKPLSEEEYKYGISFIEKYYFITINN